MTRHALYVVGSPGAGKSTLVRSLTSSWIGLTCKVPVAHTHYPNVGVVQLGAERANGFGGTDALAMNAVAPASEWVTNGEWPASLLLAEGDRLACDRFFSALIDGGWSLVVCHLDVSSEVAARRREERAERLGVEPQNPSWVKGRETKVARLVERWSTRVVTVDGGPGSLAVLQKASPVAAALGGVEWN